MQRVQSKFIYASLLKLLVYLRPKNTIYDLDDADYLLGPADTIYYFSRRCQFVSAGSQAILEHLKPRNKKIRHITSPIFHLNLIKTHKNALFTIGWIGDYGWGHKDSLEHLVFPAIRALNIPCKLILIGVKREAEARAIEAYFSDKPDIELCIPININWQNEKQIQEYITTFDVGIATLLDHPIQIAKSGIKAKQYLNNGVPVLSTPLPENTLVVKESYNGFFCHSVSDFKNRLLQLHQMPLEDYLLLSQNAFLSSTSFNHDRYYFDFMELLKMW